MTPFAERADPLAPAAAHRLPCTLLASRKSGTLAPYGGESGRLSRGASHKHDVRQSRIRARIGERSVFYLNKVSFDVPERLFFFKTNSKKRNLSRSDVERERYSRAHDSWCVPRCRIFKSSMQNVQLSFAQGLACVALAFVLC